MNSILMLEDAALYAYKAAQVAGAAIMTFYGQMDSVKAEYKADDSPVTAADKEANKIIRELLAKYQLDIQGFAPVLSEESEAPPFLERQAWARYWCVDPLDGTREFLARNDEFSVNIALIEGHQSVIGVIYSPVLQTGYCAWRGGGAYHMNARGEKERIVTRMAKKPYKIICSRHTAVEKVRAMTSHMGRVIVAQAGSALKYGRLAAGEADLMFRLSPTSEWDNAAGHCIVEEAGGGLIKLNGEPILYNCSGSLIQRDFFVYGDKQVSWLDLL
jgi:3'(2'), 5'-bisphosphate nucleotidase